MRSVRQLSPFCDCDPTRVALICGMLTLEPDERMTLSEIRAHPWCSR